MVEAGIFSGDILVVDRSIEPKHGDVVIACVDGEFTCKHLQTTPRIALVPANPAFKSIELEDGSELQIFGVVTNAIHNFRK